MLAGCLLVADAVGAAELAVTDVSATAGILPETYASPSGHSLGINWIDVDNDGWDDLFAVNGVNRSAQLYLNQQDGTFSHATDLLPNLPNYDMTGAVFADYDNDGDSDIYVYTDNEWFELNGLNPQDGPPNLLLRNLWVDNGGALPPPGEPLFVEWAEEAGLSDRPKRPFGTYSGFRAKAAAWFDYDRDGCVDLYVGHMAFQVEGEEGNRDSLYRNLCDGTFEETTFSAGIYSRDAAFSTDFRPTLAVLAGHLDQDLWPDLYLVQASPGVPDLHLEMGHHDRIFSNRGDGTFTPVEFDDVGDDAQAGMGITVGDFQRDGYWDVYISDLYVHSYELEEGVGNALYLGGPGGLSSNRALSTGVAGNDSWGVNFLDFDHDGFEDLFVGTFGAGAGRSYLFMNDSGERFSDYSTDVDFITAESRASAATDYDRDGDLDLAVVNQDGALQLFRNDSTDLGNWLQIHLVGTQSNGDAIGAVVEVNNGGLSQRRQILGGSSAHSQDSLTLHFGVGSASMVAEIEIFWPSGVRQRLQNAKTNRRYTVVETLTHPPGDRASTDTIR